MLKEIKTEILINATTEKVWSVLTNFENYPEWNPFIISVTGKVDVGNTVKVRIEPPGANGMTFKPKILVYDKNKELCWMGHLLFPGLFDGKHKFELIDNSDGTTIFRQSEQFNGILVSFFSKMLDINTLNGFNLMNQQLKRVVEEKLV